MDRAIEQAAISLGASDWVVFRRVTLPLIMPGLISGWALAFIQSFDEVTMTVFIAAPGTETLPVRMFLYIQDNIDPLVTSVSAVVIALTTIASHRARPRLRPRPAADRAGQRGGMMLEAAKRDFDVAVIGGGLVGSALALGLARAGQRVARARRGRCGRARLARQLRAGVGAEQGPGPARVRRLDHPLIRRVGASSPQSLKTETGLDVASSGPADSILRSPRPSSRPRAAAAEAPSQSARHRRLQDRDPRPQAPGR